MPPRDADESDGAVSADEGEIPAVESNETDPREQAVHHLREALAATEPDAKQFHVRQALQLLDIGDR